MGQIGVKIIHAVAPETRLDKTERPVCVSGYTLASGSYHFLFLKYFCPPSYTLSSTISHIKHYLQTIWLNLQENVITHFKRQLSSLQICLCFHSILCFFDQFIPL
ncbi:hypothetical protein Hanom_Chr06g00537881 [Helianthus anomalus]